MREVADLLEVAEGYGESGIVLEGGELGDDVGLRTMRDELVVEVGVPHCLGEDPMRESNLLGLVVGEQL